MWLFSLIGLGLSPKVSGSAECRTEAETKCKAEMSYSRPFSQTHVTRSPAVTMVI
jgi:hypothetical protein